MSAEVAATPAAWADGQAPRSPGAVRTFFSRLLTFCLAELRRIRHDQTELLTRAVQPALWLLIFGETLNRLRSIPSGRFEYLTFVAPGIMGQSALFVAIFYGIQIIWDRDAGILPRLLSTPTSRASVVSGKAFAAGIRGLAQALVILALSAALGVDFDWNVFRVLAALAVVVLGAAFFACLSMAIAGIVLARERLMGIGQMITMPLFFASTALYPRRAMPGWLQFISQVNPLSYEINALRGLLLHTHANILQDVAVLAGSLVLGIVVAARLLIRLVR